MCGITGLVDFGGNGIEPGTLQAMTDRLAHRGPDGEGMVLSWRRDDGFEHTPALRCDQVSVDNPVRVGLGHRRLAILDLSTQGHQPMSTPDGKAWVVFNGEIYNHQALRDSLLAAGHVFRSRTDTEVLLHAYQHWGTSVLDRLDGMFAFAIWDAAEGRLFCARDRLGIKPFYYACPPGRFVFASEIKAILACDSVPATADDEAVLAYLVQSSCDYAERTLFKHVKALPAAHALQLNVHSGCLRTWPYWALSPEISESVSDDERIETLRAMLMTSTRTHLVSDVRVGSCLSGGLDSSTVVSLIGKLRRDEPDAAAATGAQLFTFTSCFDKAAFDERTYALSVAHAVGATPHLVHPTAADFWSDFSRMAWHQDMPFGGLSYYAQWRVMREAHDSGVKVLLDGQGGDEVFGGYAKFRYAYMASLLRSGRLQHLTSEAVRMVRQADRYVLDLRNGYRYLPRALRRLFNVDAALRRALRADWGTVMTAESTPATRWWRHASGAAARSDTCSLTQRIQIDDIMLDTLPQLLRMEDRSSMAFSLEARVPLLDHRLVEYGIGLPDRLKIHQGWSKFAVRQAMRNLMPDEVRLRTTKLGFAAPDRDWIAEDLRPQVRELLHDDQRCRNYVDPQVLRDWYDSPAAATANTESYLGLFRVLSLEMWMRAFAV